MVIALPVNHLTEYGAGNAFAGNIFHSKASWCFSHLTIPLLVVNNQILDEVSHFNYLGCNISYAVSYTHLDVYKRQR